MTTKVNRDWFYKLASDLPEERLQSAVGLINELSDLPLPECNEEWSYVLNRLIKGLASDRNSARLGFSLCLTEVINLAIKSGPKKAPDCLKSINMFLSLLSTTLMVDSSTKASSTNNNRKKKGKEERGSLFGKLFGLQTLLADPLFDLVFFDDKQQVNDFSITFVKELIDLALRKNWIKESCLFTVYQTVERLINKQKNTTFVENIISLLDENNLTSTNEGLSIYLLLGKYDISIKPNLSLENNGWKFNNPLAKGNLPILANVLRNIPNNNSETNDNKIQSANWSPRLHFVWDVLLSELLHNNTMITEAEPSLKKQKKNNGASKSNKMALIQFPEFWKVVVDEGFFNDKASGERKYLGFLIFMKAFPMINYDLLPTCFSQNIMRSIINQSNDSKRQLHKISQKVLHCIITTCENNVETRLVPTLNALLFSKHGSINFDKLTKTKTVSKLVGIKKISNETLSQLINLFLSQVNTSNDLNHIRFILDMVLHIIRNHKSDLTSNTKQVVLPLLRGLVGFTYFVNDENSSKNSGKKKQTFSNTNDKNLELEQNLSELSQERLYSILSELTIVPTNDKHSWQYYALQNILTLEESASLKNQLDDSLLKVKKTALNILNIISKDTKDHSKNRGLEALLSICLLQLYSSDTESVSTIEELCAYYNSKKTESFLGITEILLSLLAQKRAILSKTCLLVWEQFVPEIGKDELQVILDVLQARENKQGFAQLFEGADEYEVIESDKEEEEEDTDNEDKMDETEGSDEDELSDLEESEDSFNEDALAIDRETTSALVKALNLPENIVGENGEVKFDELDDFSEANEAEEEESMDDEKMMELDDQLSEIFKRRKEALSKIPTGHKRKLEVRDSRETVIAFKQRMVDLLSIYVKYAEKLDDNIENKDQILQNLIMLIEPMIKCVQNTLDRSLAEKISKLLKTRLFKFKITSAIDCAKILTLLKTIHNDYILTTKPGQFNNLFYSLCSSSSIYMSKILVENVEENKQVDAFNDIIDLYTETTKQWLKKGKFTSSLFGDFFNWLSSKRQNSEQTS